MMGGHVVIVFVVVAADVAVALLLWLVFRFVVVTSASQVVATIIEISIIDLIYVYDWN
jgi:hypothetical protein